jgi:hypothetical protein
VLRLTALTFALLTLTAADASAAVTSCGDVARAGKNGTRILSVSADGVNCARARQVVVRQTLGKETRRWECIAAGPSEGGCTRGDKSIGYAKARSRDCGNVAFQPQTDSGAAGIRARFVSCGVARDIARASKDEPGKRFRAIGFSCRSRVFEREQDAEIVTCRREGAIVAFVRS